MSDQDAIAAFLAQRAPTVCEPGLAYGVDAEADKAKRAAERARREDERWAGEAEHRAEMAAEAFASGDREAGYEALTGYRRTSAGHYSRVRMDRF